MSPFQRKLGRAHFLFAIRSSFEKASVHMLYDLSNHTAIRVKESSDGQTKKTTRRHRGRQCRPGGSKIMTLQAARRQRLQAVQLGLGKMLSCRRSRKRWGISPRSVGVWFAAFR